MAQDSSTKPPRKKIRSYQPGNPRYYCDWEGCSASFARLEHLRRHRCIHDKSQSFICDYCRKSFTRKDIMMRHIRRQHDEQSAKGLERTTSNPEDSGSNGSNNGSNGTTNPDRANAIDIPRPMAGMDRIETDVHIQPQNQPFNYQSPNFSDNTGSPEAILGNSNALVSHLLNQDFMNWLFTQNSTPEMHNGALPETNMTNIPHTSLDQNLLADHTQLFAEPTTPFNWVREPDLNEIATKANKIASDSTPGSASNDSTTNRCNWATCNNIRSAMELEITPLVEKFICPSFVTHAVDIYWKLHMRWPILHRPSFSVNHCPPFLLVSMITISMYLCNDEDALQLAMDLHETLRYKVYSHPDFKTPTALWIFQCLLLAEIFEKMCSTEEQHDMATRFHDVLIASMRRGGKGRVDADTWKSSGPDEEKTGGDPEWERFIDHESRKRVAFFAFVVDTQHTAMFNHAPSMFISDLRFRLPCDEALWEAPDADSWRQLRDKSSAPPQFTATIGSFLRLDPSSSPPVLSPWSMMIILHGLISVGWNMRLRESMPEVKNTGGSDSANGSGGSPWIQSISESYYGWLKHYRALFIANNKLSIGHPYVLGCLTTYELAHIVLNISAQDCENFVTTLVGAKAGRAQDIRSLEFHAHTVADSIFSPRATYAVSHALDLVEMFLMGDKKYDVVADTAFHRTYCLYLAAVTIWTFQLFVGIADIHHPIESIWSGHMTDHSTNWQYESQVHTEIQIATFLGRLRGVISKLEPQALLFQRKWASTVALSRTVMEKNIIDRCDANILLRHVLNVLGPCRWKMSKF